MSITELFDKAAAPARADSITIRRPDDFHVHLRDGAMLHAVLPFTAAQFARGVIMPNLVPPVTKVVEAASYRERIRRAVPAELAFEPLMTCYLTDDADPAELLRGKQEGVWVAAKLYPAKATTNSALGVTDLRKLDRVLERMGVLEEIQAAQTHQRGVSIVDGNRIQPRGQGDGPGEWRRKRAGRAPLYRDAGRRIPAQRDGFANRRREGLRRVCAGCGCCLSSPKD